MAGKRSSTRVHEVPTEAKPTHPTQTSAQRASCTGAHPGSARGFGASRRNVAMRAKMNEHTLPTTHTVLCATGVFNLWPSYSRISV